MRRLVTNHPVELEGRDGYETFLVSLWTDAASVLGPHGKFLKRGSPTFRRVLKAMHDRADDGSLVREDMAQCADTADL